MPEMKTNGKELLIIFVLLAAALAAYFAAAGLGAKAQKGAYAEITYENKVAARVPLDSDGSFSIDGLPNVVFEIKGKSAAFASSDCPDKVCVNTGWLSAEGQTASCLPNKVTLRITGFGGEGADAVSQ